MAWELNQIWIVSFKLRANLAKFVKDFVAMYKVTPLPNPALSIHNKVRFKAASYIDVVRCPPQSSYHSSHTSGIKEKEQTHQCPEVKSHELEHSWLRESFSGVLKTVNILLFLDDKLVEVGIRNCFIRPIGGNLILLIATREESSSNYERESFLLRILVRDNLPFGPKMILVLAELFGLDAGEFLSISGQKVSSRSWPNDGALNVDIDKITSERVILMVPDLLFIRRQVIELGNL
ncbi:hypothetical protein Ancab_031871 [Ancistrocladus abbreviatus]